MADGPLKSSDLLLVNRGNSTHKVTKQNITAVYPADYVPTSTDTKFVTPEDLKTYIEENVGNTSLPGNPKPWKDNQTSVWAFAAAVLVPTGDIQYRIIRADGSTGTWYDSSNQPNSGAIADATVNQNDWIQVRWNENTVLNGAHQSKLNGTLTANTGAVEVASQAYLTILYKVPAGVSLEPDEEAVAGEVTYCDSFVLEDINAPVTVIRTSSDQAFITINGGYRLGVPTAPDITTIRIDPGDIVRVGHTASVTINEEVTSSYQFGFGPGNVTLVTFTTKTNSESSNNAGVIVDDGTNLPAVPEQGQLWYNTNDGRMYVWYNDGDSA